MTHSTFDISQRAPDKAPLASFDVIRDIDGTPLEVEANRRDSKPTASRKSRLLFGNRLRWAKTVIEEALAQRRAKKR